MYQSPGYDGVGSEWCDGLDVPGSEVCYGPRARNRGPLLRPGIGNHNVSHDGLYILWPFYPIVLR